MPDQHVLEPRGPFSLRAAAEFGFGPNEGRAPTFDGAMRLAFAVDGGTGYAGAVLRQDELHGPVRVSLALRGEVDRRRVIAQVQRIISLDYDGERFTAVGEADPVLGDLQRAHPGQRPVLFHSPYEGAAWSIISARRASAQAARVRSELSIQLGESFELAGRTLHAFPQPEHLLELGDQFPGLSLQKLARLRDVAGAAAAGELDVAHLHDLGPDRAFSQLQRLAGIGPFYAGLIVLRAAGFADAMLPAPEPRVLARVAELYGMPQAPSLNQLSELAQRWRPYRTWALVLIRLAGERAATGR